MPDTTSSPAKARLLFDPAEMAYDFGAQHPMQPRRLEALIDLLAMSNLWNQNDEQTRLHGRVATQEEVSLVHTPEYVVAVQRLSTPAESVTSDNERRELAQLALRYGFGDGDTPAIPGMHDVAARIAGGTLA